MDPMLLRAREQILTRLWAAQDRAAPDYDTPALRAAGKEASARLNLLIGRMDKSVDRVEVGNTWRYLGDAYFCSSGKEDQADLRAARSAYLEAERFLEHAGDAAALGKLHFNFANTLRLIKDGHERANLEEARSRYYQALNTFRALEPDAVPSIEASLRHVEVSLRALGFLESADEERRQLQQLRQKLEAAGPDPDAALLHSLNDEIARLDASKTASRLESFMRTMSSSGELPGLDLAGMLASFQQDDAVQKPRPTDEGDQLLQFVPLLYSQIQQAVDRGELTGTRSQALVQLLGEFEELARQVNGLRDLDPATYVHQSLILSTRMRELMAAYKSIQMSPSPPHKPAEH